MVASERRMRQVGRNLGLAAGVEIDSWVFLGLEFGLEIRDQKSEVRGQKSAITISTLTSDF
jgi:hypothetical protein